MRAFRGWMRAWLTAADRAGAHLIILGVVAFTQVQVAVQIRFNVWSRDFFNALEQRDAAAFRTQILIFPGLATVSMAAAASRISKGRLDDGERWDRVLSLGAQQRLAFARLPLQRPRWIFLDEATSAR